MSFASWKDRKPIAQALRSVYRAETAKAGLAALDAFEAGHWGKRHPAIALSCRRHWDQVIPFFAFPEGVRRIIYTTDRLERLNKEVKRRADVVGIFPKEDSIVRLIRAVLLEQNGEYQVQRRYMQLEGMTALATPQIEEVAQLQITPKAA